MNPSESPDLKNFSLVLGGPFFQALRKAHLTGNALELVKKRTLIITLIAWLPLMLLSLLSGQAWGSSVELPFIEDLEVQVRYLVALPLLVIAELMVHERMRAIVNQFQERNLIPQSALAQFNQSIASAYRLRNSYVAEALMVILIYIIGYNVVWEKSMAVEATTWYSKNNEGTQQLSAAGLWFRFVSLPLFQFLFLRWYYRIFIWARFLFQISKIKLRLVPTHPDHVGGLGFISNIVFAFMPLAFMHGSVLAGMIANHIFHEGTTLLDHKIEIIVIVVIVLLLVMVPLLAFSSQLADTKRSGAMRYGKLAVHYGHNFETKWFQNTEAQEELLGSNDIQSLADLQNAFEKITQMSMVPITRGDIILLVLTTLAPVAPLLLTLMPVDEILKLVMGVFF